MTDSSIPNRRPRPGARIAIVRLLAGLMTVVVIAASCGDDGRGAASDEPANDEPANGDSANDEPANERADNPFTGVDDRGRRTGPDDAERDFADEPADEPAEEAGDGLADAPAPAESLFDRDSGYTDDGGGLFGPDIPSGEPDPTRTESNFFQNYGVRPFVDPDDDPLSTFALDVDTASYTVARRWLTEGLLPEPDSVRVEEFINFFDYDYDTPRSGLEITVDGGPSPFDDGDVLVRIGVQAARIDDRERDRAALTFVVDTSGSMDRDDRLGLVKEALEELVGELDDDDTVAIVTYGDSSAVILEPTSADDRDIILDAIDDLRPGGSTNLEAGLRTGYDLAERAFVEDGINRVILASDGVANVGNVDPAELAEQVHDRAINGIQLVTIGVGMGNFNDVTMEQLADRGDGFYAYVDTFDEAERLFEDELIATLSPVAIDARIQVEWDDRYVDSYRLIGFENRGVLDSEFRSTDVDAGELSSGHTVTAVYELDLDRDAEDGVELGEITLRWLQPDGDRDWVEITEDIDYSDIELDWDRASDAMRLATTVVAWAEVLRGSPFADDIDLAAVAAEAENLADDLDTALVDELAELTEIAARLR